MISTIKPALLLLVVFTLLTGVIYPVVITGIGQLLFPSESNGSAIVSNGRVVGSKLIGQAFTDPKYFWPRPSATAAFPYDASSSLGSNLGPINPTLLDAFHARTSTLTALTGSGKPPVDLITASASGLDPHISPEAALYQAARVASARALPIDAVRALIAEHTEGRSLGLFGEPRVNVLELNLALDQSFNMNASVKRSSLF